MIEWEREPVEMSFRQQLACTGRQWLEGDHDVAWYYSQQALRHNPQNQYVLKYTEAMNLGVKK